MTPVVVTLPLRLVSEANAHEHWRHRQKRAREHHAVVNMVATVPMRDAAMHLHRGTDLVVTITRVAPRMLDSDGAVISGKYVRDAIAKLLGINDNDPRVEWRYAQRKGKVREYAVEIKVEAKP
jgi:hypothetical protein